MAIATWASARGFCPMRAKPWAALKADCADRSAAAHCDQQRGIERAAGGARHRSRGRGEPLEDGLRVLQAGIAALANHCLSFAKLGHDLRRQPTRSTTGECQGQTRGGETGHGALDTARVKKFTEG